MGYHIVKYDRKIFIEDIMSSVLIKMVDCDYELGTNLKIGDKVYHVCAKSDSNKIIGVDELTLVDEPEELYYETFFTCPVCSYVNHDAFELDDNEGEHDCGNCGATLEYTRNVEITYSTSVKKKNEPVEI